MTLAKYVFFLLLAGILMPLAASGNEPQQVVVRGKQDPSSVVIKGVRDPSAWFRIESQHMIVYSDDDPADVIELVNNLERLDYLLRLYLKPFMNEEVSLAKTTLYFQARESWPPEIGKAPQGDIGMASSCVPTNAPFMYGVRKSWKLRNSSLLRAEDDYTLMHSLWRYAEHFLYRHTRIRGPVWFVTGFAAYFGGVRFTDTQMAIGRDAGTSYNLLQTIDDGRSVSRLTFDQVLRYKHTGKQVLPGSRESYEGWEFMGRSFNLMHYVLSTEENRARMAVYLDAVNNGGDAVAAFADVFGLSGGALDSAMWRYRQASLKILQVDMPGLPRAHIDFTRLSRIEGEFVLYNAVLKACPAPADGRKLLARLSVIAARAPAVDFAQLTLSRAQITWGDPRAAIDYLSRAVDNDPYHTEAHFLLGLAYAKLAEAGQHDFLAPARSALTQAAVLAPESAEIAYALFRLELVGKAPTGTDMARAIRAWRHRYDVPAFARMAALAYAWQGDGADAYQALNTLARTEQDPDNAAWAASWIARLHKGVPRNELLAAMRGEERAQRTDTPP